jgi:putative transposase
MNVLFQMLPDVVSSRKKRPTKGGRRIYEEFAHKWPLGRDKSIALLMDSGYRVRFPKKYYKATQSGTREFANLLVNKKVNNINQVWQSDMAHYMFGEKRFYTIYITDVYSQEIVGHGAFTHNHADNYNAVLLKAIRSQKTAITGLIHHSDGGKQYESIIYKSTCKKYGIIQSMCMYSFENPYAEKTNDLINNGYLNVWKPLNIK